MTVGTANTAAPTRTQRLRQIAAMRILTRAEDDRRALVRVFFTSYGVRENALDRDNPVTPQIEGQLLVQPLDERRAVLVQEREKSDRSFLSVAAGERERASVDELTPQRFVAPLGSLDHLAVQRLEVALHPLERRACGPFERRIERRQCLHQPRP